MTTIICILLEHFLTCFTTAANNKSNTTGATSKAETAYPFATPEFLVIFLVLVEFVLFIWQITCTCFHFLTQLAEGKISFHHHLASVGHLISSAYIKFESSPLKPLGQMNQNLVGSIYGRSAIKIAFFVPICRQQ